MPLPFIAGLALGSVAMLAFTKRKVLQKEITLGAQKAKELAAKGVERSKAKYEEVKGELQKSPKEAPAKGLKKSANPKKEPALKKPSRQSQAKKKVANEPASGEQA